MMEQIIVKITQKSKASLDEAIHANNIIIECDPGSTLLIATRYAVSASIPLCTFNYLSIVNDQNNDIQLVSLKFS